MDQGEYIYQYLKNHPDASYDEIKKKYNEYLESQEDSKAHNITSKSPMDSSKASVDAAFFGAYYDPHDFIKSILEDLDSHVENWIKETMYANYTSVTQASGMGKSRMVKQLAEEGVYVIYCCLRLSGSGYPPQSHIAKYLLDSYDKLHFVAYFISCLNKLADTPGTSSTDWYNQQIARENDGASQENAREFWDDIRLRMENLKRGLADGDASARLRQSYERALRAYPNIRNIPLPKNILRICFVFEEARCLLEVGPITEKSGSKTADKNLAFYNMRRALVHFDDKVNVFTLVMDTVSRLSNFQPIRTADPSARVATGGKRLFEPLYLCVTTDVMAKRIDMKRKLEDAVRPSILYRYGRPMWGAHIDNRGREDMETYLRKLVLLAFEKIIGGKSPSTEVIDHTSALAILAIRLCLHVSPLAQLSAEL
ncbi:11265_t:CDS:2, partial [Ambispora leptoticha]